MVTHNGKAYRQFQAARAIEDQHHRIKAVFGQSFLDQALYFEEQIGSMQLKGLDLAAHLLSKSGRPAVLFCE